MAEPRIKNLKSYLEYIRDLKHGQNFQSNTEIKSPIKFTIYHSSSKTRHFSRICLAQLYILSFQSRLFSILTKVKTRHTTEKWKLLKTLFLKQLFAEAAEGLNTKTECQKVSVLFWSGKVELRMSVASCKIREKVAR